MRVKKGNASRIWALGLCLALALTLLPGAGLAVETFSASEECVELIKEFEDYREMPYVDSNGKWYVGYGVTCQPSDFPNGVSEEEADMLLRMKLLEAESAVNQLLTQYSISATQYQFDAMVSMTYTLGTQWINPSYRLCSYLINGVERYTEAEVVNAIATWCHSGTLVLENLVTRRLREAFLFLYGAYENNGPESYCYIDYETNGGVWADSQDSRTVFYPVGLPYGELPEPALPGQTFQGWYTGDGRLLTGEEQALGSLHVFARWSAGGGNTGTVPPVEEIDYSSWVNPYSDVSDGDWYYPYVRELSWHKILGGYPDGTFRSGNKLSAGEALRLIMTATTKVDPGNASSGHWASNYLAQAEGLACLMPGEITNLDGEIDRMTIARITAVAMGLAWVDGPPPFADTDDGYTLALYEAGILAGEIKDGRRYFHPDAGITRAEMCAIISRVRNYKPPNIPSQSGYIEYRNKRIPVLWDVPAAPYNKDLFVRDGSRMYYNDPNYATALGVDVSRHNGDIDWRQVADYGIEFALIRIGGRFAESGDLYDDANFEANLAGAKAAGVKTGVYFYSQAVSVEEAVEEARYTIERLGGQSLEYPVIFDWEIYSSTARSYGVSKETVTACAIAFCDTVAMAGYTPMIYMGLEVGYNRLDLSQLTGYDFWFAQYNERNQPDMYYDYRIWQYTDSGNVPGIGGRVDMNLALIPY